MIDYEKLHGKMDALHQQWKTAQPFPHVVIKDFLTTGACQEIAGGFEEVLFEKAKKDPNAVKKHRDVLRKIGTSNPAIMTSSQQQFFEQINSPAFIALLEKMTGISPLYTDLDYNGGGLHQIFPGGYLNVHVDFNFHPKTRMLRRLNLILYLNEDWQDEWNGGLELWDNEFAKPPVRIMPRINTVAMFETSETSWHGHPDPLACPEGRSRKSLAVYYYSPWPGNLWPRSKTRYVLTPKQQLKLDEEVEKLLAQNMGDTQIIAALSQWQKSHVVGTCRRLRPSPLKAVHNWWNWKKSA